MATIEPFIHRKIVTLTEDATVAQAARALCSHRIGAVMVSNKSGRFVGIVTDRDLVCRSMASGSGLNQKLSEVVTRSLVTIDQFATVNDVIGLMEYYGVRRIPVIRRTKKEREKCVGMVTLDDLLVAQSIESARAARIVRSQVFRRLAKGTDKSSPNQGLANLRYFIHEFARQMAVPNDTALKAARCILELLIQRLHFTGAAHLMLQLPRALQEQLIELASGPDRSITAQSFVNNVMIATGAGHSEAMQLIYGFWMALERLVDRDELKHVFNQLPADIQELFAQRIERAAA